MKNLNTHKIILAGTALAVLIAGLYIYTGEVSDTQGESGTTSGDTGKNSDNDSTPDKPSGKNDKSSAKVSRPKVKDLPIKNQPKVSSKKEATEVLKKNKPDLGLGVDDNLEVQGSTSDRKGNQYYHVTQTYKGIPVFGHNAVLEVEQGKAVVISGSWQDKIKVNTKPKYDAKQALTMAFNKLGMTQDPEFTLTSKATLVIIVSETKQHLAWSCNVSFKVPVLDAENIIVDAQNPEFLIRAPLVAN